MDWGFLDHTSTGHKNKYLRDELLYAGGKKVGFSFIMIKVGPIGSVSL